MAITSAAEVDALLARARELGASDFLEGYFDHNGHLRTKRVHLDHLAHGIHEGVALHTAVFTTDPGNAIIPDVCFSDPDYGFPDATLRLDAKSAREAHLGGQPSLLLLGNLMPPHADFCVRGLLADLLERLHREGLSVRAAFEYEWRLLDETAASLARAHADSVRVAPGAARFYSVVDQADQHALLDDLVQTHAAMNVAVNALHTEYTDLLELSLLPAKGVEAADRAGLAKTLCKVVARRHQRTASFMAMLNPEGQGCGAHINLSLTDADGAPANLDPGAPHGLSASLRHFLGGLQRYLPELFLLLAPNLNSYRRFRPGLFTPLTNTWGINNKTVAFRVVNQGETRARIECRIPGADVNPHLALWALVCAGRRGIAEGIAPDAPVEGDGWAQESKRFPPFPLTFPAAIERFAGSSVAAECLAPEFIACFVAGRRWQLEALANTITDWEIRTFAEGA